MRQIRLIKTIEELHELVGNGQVLLFGAGNVAVYTISYLLKMKRDTRLSGIMVSDLSNNPKELFGLEVNCPDEWTEYTETATVLVCLLEKNQPEVIDLLSQGGYQNIGLMQDELYYEVRDRMSNYEEIIPKEKYMVELQNWYQRTTGEKLDFSNLQTYNEKIQWIKLYGVTPLMQRLADKYEVRDWVAEKIGEEYLVKVLGVWKDVEEIPFDELPHKFVLKCNHGCGFNIIVKDKDKINREEIKGKLREWMKKNFAFKGGLELQYKDIVPRIIAEEYMENEDEDLYDYKFWCFEGRVEFIMFLSERQKKLKMNNFDKEWNLLPFTYDYEQGKKEIKKPAQLEKMIEIAEKLAQGFSHVRVDLYLLNNGEIKFGEMTFTSANGTCRWSDADINYRLGQLIKCV